VIDMRDDAEIADMRLIHVAGSRRASPRRQRGAPGGLPSFQSFVRASRVVAKARDVRSACAATGGHAPL
jgi:hypothetical protein